MAAIFAPVELFPDGTPLDEDAPDDVDDDHAMVARP